MDGTVYFDELYGGSRNSGFIQRMLAETPEDLEIDYIQQPSMWLQQHYPLYGEEKKPAVNVKQQIKDIQLYPNVF
jgi:hypothetical protein